MTNQELKDITDKQEQIAQKQKEIIDTAYERHLSTCPEDSHGLCMCINEDEQEAITRLENAYIHLEHKVDPVWQAKRANKHRQPASIKKKLTKREELKSCRQMRPNPLRFAP